MISELMTRGMAKAAARVTGIANDASWQQIAKEIGHVGDQSRPILIQRGLGSLDRHYTQLASLLKRVGFDVHVVSIGRHGMASIEKDAAHLARQVEALAAKHVAAGGDGKITIIGHSKGGVSARWYLQRMGGIEHVHELITLGTPHNGSAPLGHSKIAKLASNFAPHAGTRDIVAPSRIIRELNSDLPGFLQRAQVTNPEFRMVSIAGDVGGPLLAGQDGLVSVGNATLQSGGATNAYTRVIKDAGANHFDIAANIGVHEPTMRVLVGLLADGAVPSDKAIAKVVARVRGAHPAAGVVDASLGARRIHAGGR